VADVAVEGSEALLLVPVDVLRERVPGLLGRPEERVEQRVVRGAALEDQRTVVAAPGVPAAMQLSIFLKYGRQCA
jgi:hypothetical protein